MFIKVLAERDSLGLRGDELARKLDDITHELKVEAHRHTLTAGRVRAHKIKRWMLSHIFSTRGGSELHSVPTLFH
jgi:hypothetical protein